MPGYYWLFTTDNISPNTLSIPYVYIYRVLYNLSITYWGTFWLLKYCLSILYWRTVDKLLHPTDLLLPSSTINSLPSSGNWLYIYFNNSKFSYWGSNASSNHNYIKLALFALFFFTFLVSMTGKLRSKSLGLLLIDLEGLVSLEKNLLVFLFYNY